MHFKFHPKGSQYILAIAIFVNIVFCGYHFFSEAKNHEYIHDDSNSRLSFVIDETSRTSFSEIDFINKFQGTLKYYGVTNVKVRIGDTLSPIEDAISDGKITFNDIHYIAQKDAETGICSEEYESKLGLSRFHYDYSSYKLVITNDIYETPDGKQHQIREIIITYKGCNPISMYPELDQEDWGIEFEVTNATPNGIVISYTQSGGQLIGQLRTGNYDLSRTDVMKVVLPLDYTLPEPIMIQHNTESSISLDFEQRFGILESGNYLLYLYLHDQYDEEQVPPLVRNYHDIQCYTVEFSIP